MPEAEVVNVDQAARERVATDLGTTLFVEAGAGSGKTTALVGRVVALVTSGDVDLGSIAAITFTEKAGAELRDRIRQRLEIEANRSDVGADRTARCRAALDELDSSAIGTLHAFAQRLLAESPIEARLPPRIEVLDEVSSGVEFERRWVAFRDGMLAEPALERTLLLLFACGVKPVGLRSLALAFDRNWDLVEERVPAAVDDPPSVRDALAPVLADVASVCQARHQCRDEDDKLFVALDEGATWLAEVVAIDDDIDLLEAVSPQNAQRPRFPLGVGKAPVWDADLKELRATMRQLRADLDEAVTPVAVACAKRIGSELRHFTLAAADQRRTAGQLEFHDLLVLARGLLSDPAHGAAVRRRLHQRYQRLLLDEFQDTDPIQIELAVRIAATSPGSESAGQDPWPEVEVAPGHLFVVGDPKQSIYRFRRADIQVFLDAQRWFGRDGRSVELSTNFRSGAPIIEWVNATFGHLIRGSDESGAEVPSQPRYKALDPVRPGPSAGPPVSILGRDPHPPKTPADVLRAAEADEVAAAVTGAVAEGWTVEDRTLGSRTLADAAGWRPARLGDITILLPARTSLPFLEDSLDAAGIAYRTESSSLVYATRAVRDLLMVLRAVDDPTDHLRIVSALRTPLLGCGDDDLARFRVGRGGRWNYVGSQPDTVPADDPVATGLRVLADLHGEGRWRAPSELLDRIVRDRRALELGFAEGRPRDVWRRIRFVIDQARGWHESTGGTLREYLRWVGQQTAEGARVAEAVLPETDDDAVRIMTIHAAKGLEFPITILSGLSTGPQNHSAPGEVRFPATGGVAYRFGAKVVTPEFNETKPLDEQMSYDERIRLLYVAATRARDHLIVSLHRTERATEPEPAKRTNAELLRDGMGPDLLAELPDTVGEGTPPTRPKPPPTPDPPPPFAAWASERVAALAVAGRPTTVSATGLTDEGAPDPSSADETPEPVEAGLDKRPRDLDLPPWLKGRYGTAVGRAVHGVLQTVDLATAAGLDGAVAAQCQAEAIPERGAEVRALVRRALGSSSVREAAALPHWREVYACVPVEGDRLLEGYVDLLYRTTLGLVVVDHKTAATADPAELDRRVDGYRRQGAAYALVVSETTGEPVVRVTFLFLTPDGAVERHLDDLAEAVQEVRTLVASGAEVVA